MSEPRLHPQSQPVASRLGPRYLDWQLVQPTEESWRECHLHARNLLGEPGYQALLAQIAGRPFSYQPSESIPTTIGETQAPYVSAPEPKHGKLFDD